MSDEDRLAGRGRWDGWTIEQIQGLEEEWVHMVTESIKLTVDVLRMALGFGLTEVAAKARQSLVEAAASDDPVVADEARRALGGGT